MIALLKDADVWKEEYEEIIEQINEECELCKIYAKTPSSPVVGMPMASKFNEKVAMDLKLWNDIWILHIIDMWSRYTLSTFVERKRPSNIIDALMTQLIGKFGVMKALLTDNGGEFNSDEIRVITSVLSVQLCTTSGESPIQNGLCERVHAITDMMLVKLEADFTKINSQTLLSWANMARNSLQMWNGYSSHQLVFGETPNLSNIMNNNMPALQGTTSSEVFAQHLNALHAACKAFIQTEADERIRRALWNKVRASEQIFENGERVFYKCEGKERWLGPGTVVFQDEKVVFVRHGSVFVRVSPNRLQQKVKSYLTDENEKKIEHSIEERQDKKKDDNEKTETHTITEEVPVASLDKEDTTQNVQKIRKTVKTNDNIRYKVKDKDEWTIATVLGRAGKATGNNRYWYNIQDDISKEKKSLNLDQVEWQLITDDANVYSVQKQNNISSEDTSAKLAELQKSRHFNTYQEDISPLNLHFYKAEK